MVVNTLRVRVHFFNSVMNCFFVMFVSIFCLHVCIYRMLSNIMSTALLVLTVFALFLLRLFVVSSFMVSFLMMMTQFFMVSFNIRMM